MKMPHEPQLMWQLMKGTNTPMLERAAENTIKMTVAESLNDALEIIHFAARESQHLSVDDYLAEMVGRDVDVTAAQDTLRFLKGTGEISLSDTGFLATSQSRP